MHILLPVNLSCLVEMGELALLVVGFGIVLGIAAIWVMRLAVAEDRYALH